MKKLKNLFSLFRKIVVEENDVVSLEIKPGVVISVNGVRFMGKKDGFDSVVLEDGAKVSVQGRGGWRDDLYGRSDGADLEHRNVDQTGLENFFTFSTVGDQYGAGKIFQERSYARPLAGIKNLTDGLLVGAIVVDGEKKVIGRFSWTNLKFMKKKDFLLDGNGSLTVDGEQKGYLSMIFLPDKNRMAGYVGVFTPTEPAEVKIMEMETLVISSL